MSKSRYNNPKRLTNSCNKGLKLEWEEILPKHKHEFKNCVSAKFKIPKVCTEKQRNQSDLNPSGQQVIGLGLAHFFSKKNSAYNFTPVRSGHGRAKVGQGHVRMA